MSAAAIVCVLAFGVLAAASVPLTVIDVREHRLPNAIVLPLYPVALAAAGAVALFLGDAAVLLRAVACGLALFAVFALLRSVGGGMGGGDVKLAGVLGIFLGILGWAPAIAGAALAFVLGGVWSLFLLMSRRVDRTTRIAFGPFMIAAAWTSVGIVVLG